MLRFNYLSRFIYFLKLALLLVISFGGSISNFSFASEGAKKIVNQIGDDFRLKRIIEIENDLKLYERLVNLHTTPNTSSNAEIAALKTELTYLYDEYRGFDLTDYFKKFPKKRVPSVDQNRALQNRALQNRALQNRALQNRALQNRALQNRVLQNRALQNRVLQNRALQNSERQNRVRQNRVRINARLLRKLRERFLLENDPSKKKELRELILPLMKEQRALLNEASTQSPPKIPPRPPLAKKVSKLKSQTRVLVNELEAINRNFQNGTPLNPAKLESSVRKVEKVGEHIYNEQSRPFEKAYAKLDLALQSVENNPRVSQQPWKKLFERFGTWLDEKFSSGTANSAK